jgi:hypothetical protein
VETEWAKSVIIRADSWDHSDLTVFQTTKPVNTIFARDLSNVCKDLLEKIRLKPSKGLSLFKSGASNSGFTMKPTCNMDVPAPDTTAAAITGNMARIHVISTSFITTKAHPTSGVPVGVDAQMRDDFSATTPALDFNVNLRVSTTTRMLTAEVRSWLENT